MQRRPDQFIGDVGLFGNHDRKFRSAGIIWEKTRRKLNYGNCAH
jgi:hypothetical protein